MNNENIYITPSKLTIIGLDNINKNHKIHYLVYKITFKTNDFYYIGQHKTSLPLDNYTGSGVLIINYRKKYGLNNMIKEILFDFDNYNDMDSMEHKLVPIDINGKYDELCLNLMEGGHSCHQTLELREKLSKKWNEKSNDEKQRIKNIIIQKNKEHWNKKTDDEIEEWKRFCRQINKGKNSPLYGIPLKSHMDPKKYDELIQKNTERFRKNAKILGEKRKGKTLEELYGKEKADEIKMKNRMTHIGKKGKNIKQYMSDNEIKEWKKKLSIANSGKNNPAYNRKWIYNKLTLERKYIHQDEIFKYIYTNSDWVFGIPKNKSNKSGMAFAINRLKRKYPNVDFSEFDYSKYAPSVGKSRFKYLNDYIKSHLI